MDDQQVDREILNTKRRQYVTVFFIEVGIILFMSLVAWSAWEMMCDQSWKSCLSDESIKPLSFLLLSMLRPLLFTPTFIMTIIGGESFGYFGGVFLAIIGTVLSTMVIYFPAKILGKKFIKPWLSSNLPAMLQLIRTQDYKVVVATRLIPFFPFDFMSILFGVADFRTKSVILGTLVGMVPEALLFARIVATDDKEVISLTISNLATLSVGIVVFLLIYELFFRKDGSNIIVKTRRVYQELIEELKANNSIIKRHEYHNESTPIVMLYGFFSSRRTLTILEKLLTTKNHQVMSFNLGGLFGVFNTRSITETARFIDRKIKRQRDRHGFKKFHLICHSKGGLVGLWWVLKLGGHKYCDTVITMGTPFKGSILTYLALVTPLGFIWRDVWQMRPGSTFLEILHRTKIPDNVRVYCLHSVKDKVAKGREGCFTPDEESVGKKLCEENQITSIPMNHCAHFEFLFRRDVGNVLDDLIRQENVRTSYLNDPNNTERMNEKDPLPTSKVTNHS